jgi:hypothetical protein
MDSRFRGTFAKLPSAAFGWHSSADCADLGQSQKQKHPTLSVASRDFELPFAFGEREGAKPSRRWHSKQPTAPSLARSAGEGWGGVGAFPINWPATKAQSSFPISDVLQRSRESGNDGRAVCVC